MGFDQPRLGDALHVHYTTVILYYSFEETTGERVQKIGPVDVKSARSQNKPFRSVAVANKFQRHDFGTDTARIAGRSARCPYPIVGRASEGFESEVTIEQKNDDDENEKNRKK